LGNPPLKVSYHGGRTKPLICSTEHPILLNIGLGHHKIPNFLSKCLSKHNCSIYIVRSSALVVIWQIVICFQGEGLTSIEPTTGAINDVCTFPGSGLILLALDSSQIPSYFIPSLGPAPKWCSSLENFTVWLQLLRYYYYIT
jgi:hypothetical protein